MHVVAVVLSPMESVFFKVVQSLCHSAVTQQTQGTENHFGVFADEIAASFIEHTANTIWVKYCPLLKVI